MNSLDPALDLFPLAASLLAAITCAVLGNFLLLRRESLMGDAISHGVLPGLVIGFLLTGDRDPTTMLAGATAAGIVTVLLVMLVRNVGRVESGAAMGVVFSVLFAIGVLLIERAARQTDLDADCVLHGQLETLAWYDAPTEWSGVPAWATVESIPRQVWGLAIACTLACGFVLAFFKELRLAAFDPELAAALGLRPKLIDLATMILVAIATVASFEAVGSILVIAMLICPAATARLLTDRLSRQVTWSILIASITAAVGYRAATVVPSWFEAESVNAAGSMTVAAGVVLLFAILAAPTHGVISKRVRATRLRRQVAIDDLLASLLRLEESSSATDSATSRSTRIRRASPPTIERARGSGLVTGKDWPTLSLTEEGRRAARDVLRRHRLWETYLVEKAGFSPDHVHDPAEVLEHLGPMPPELATRDPHGRTIPSPDRTDRTRRSNPGPPG
ncbi:MAG: iron chelate uptake ABC transporter family permease subunit [Phycisphaera sp.]|nr:iron chelate uptake ABC transporter family permease subunit [Phycisphaera sp.]